MVVDALGGVAVYPVKPEYTFSTDDTTCYVFEGTESGKDKWTLVSTDSIKRRLLVTAGEHQASMGSGNLLRFVLGRG